MFHLSIGSLLKTALPGTPAEGRGAEQLPVAGGVSPKANGAEFLNILNILRGQVPEEAPQLQEEALPPEAGPGEAVETAAENEDGVEPPAMEHAETDDTETLAEPEGIADNALPRNPGERGSSIPDVDVSPGALVDARQEPVPSGPPLQTALSTPDPSIGVEPRKTQVDAGYQPSMTAPSMARPPAEGSNRWKVTPNTQIGAVPSGSPPVPKEALAEAVTLTEGNLAPPRMPLEKTVAQPANVTRVADGAGPDAQPAEPKRAAIAEHKSAATAEVEVLLRDKQPVPIKRSAVFQGDWPVDRATPVKRGAGGAASTPAAGIDRADAPNVSRKVPAPTELSQVANVEPRLSDRRAEKLSMKNDGVEGNLNRRIQTEPRVAPVTGETRRVQADVASGHRPERTAAGLDVKAEPEPEMPRAARSTEEAVDVDGRDRGPKEIPVARVLASRWDSAVERVSVEKDPGSTGRSEINRPPVTTVPAQAPAPQSASAVAEPRPISPNVPDAGSARTRADVPSEAEEAATPLPKAARPVTEVRQPVAQAPHMGAQVLSAGPGIEFSGGTGPDDFGLQELRGVPEPSGTLRPQTATGMPVSLEDLPKLLVRHVQNGAGAGKGAHFDISLSPAELGKVRITIAHGEAAVAVTIVADRPETLDLMRRHADQLAQDFRSLGHEKTEFSFGSSAGGRQNGGMPQGAGAQADEPAAMSGPAPQMTATSALDAGTGRVDIRI